MDDTEREMIERELHGALIAYEAMRLELGKSTPESPSRFSRMFERLGAIEATERLMQESALVTGYAALTGAGKEDLSFEAVVIRHPEAFSSMAVERARRRQCGWRNLPQ